MGCGSSSPDKAAADEEHKAPDVGGAGGIAPQTQSDARTDDTTNSSPLRRQPTMADAIAAAAKAGEAAAAGRVRMNPPVAARGWRNRRGRFPAARCFGRDWAAGEAAAGAGGARRGRSRGCRRVERCTGETDDDPVM